MDSQLYELLYSLEANELGEIVCKNFYLTPPVPVRIPQDSWADEISK